MFRWQRFVYCSLDFGTIHHQQLAGIAVAVIPLGCAGAGVFRPDNGGAVIKPDFIWVLFLQHQKRNILV